MPTILSVPMSILSTSVRYGVGGGGLGVVALSGALGPVSWPANNRAIYVPITLPFDYQVARVVWANGGTPTGNADLGIYNRTTLAKIFSTGSVARSGATVNQYTAATWYIPAGEYYMALANSTTGSFQASAFLNLTICRLCGMLQEAATVPLPGTATPVAITSAYLPLFGLLRT